MAAGLVLVGEFLSVAAGERADEWCGFKADAERVFEGATANTNPGLFATQSTIDPSIFRSQTALGRWTYNLTFPPLANYSIFQGVATITVSGLCGVSSAGGPTSTDFPSSLDAVNLNWTVEVLNGGTGVRWSHAGSGPGNFSVDKHIFGFSITAPAAGDGIGSLITSGFSRDTSNPLPDGSFNLDINISNISVHGPATCTGS